jgi:hypothetical protein
MSECTCWRHEGYGEPTDVLDPRCRVHGYPECGAANVACTCVSVYPRIPAGCRVHGEGGGRAAPERARAARLSGSSNPVP